MSNKIKLTSSAILIIFVGVLTFKLSVGQSEETVEAIKNPTKVSVQSVKDSSVFQKTIQYPGTVVGDQEVSVTAGESGSIQFLNFDLGKAVYAGQTLATIDSLGNNAKIGDNGFKNSQIRALELAVESAEKNYKIAKDNYKEDDSYANKKTKEIAELTWQSAKASLRGALDNQSVISPISGTVVKKYVSQGDSVSAGQTLAVISRTNQIKIQFFVSQEEFLKLKINNEISIEIEEGKSISGKITNINPQADDSTKRYLIEAVVENGQNNPLIGSIVTVSLNINYAVQDSENIILPLSAVTIGQNESYILVNDNNKAKKIEVQIIKVNGGIVEIKTGNINSETQIIIDGGKMIQDGEDIEIAK